LNIAGAGNWARAGRSNLFNPFLFIFILFFLFSCRNDKSYPGAFNDAGLFALTTDTAGTTYYQNGNILSAAGNSPHGSFKLRFNAKATSVLNGQLELSPSGIFPDSSLLVKEVFSGTTLQLYAVMFKHKGEWAWAEYGVTGNVIYSLANQGGACISCHSQSPNRDLVRTFDLH